jgi:flagellar basal-body rod modification protein FlgD
MTTQLQNQDPFAPMENGDFIAQMAQFSTVTGITEMGTQMKAINDKLDSFRIATASQYLGHSVLVPGNVVRANGKDNVEGVIDVPNATTKLQVFFQKENGEIIDQLDLGGQSRGLVGFSWDKVPEEIKKDNEKIFISAFLGDNPDQALATSVFSKVLGTSTENNQIKLDVDGYGLIDASKAVRFRN